MVVCRKTCGPPSLFHGDMPMCRLPEQHVGTVEHCRQAISVIPTVEKYALLSQTCSTNRYIFREDIYAPKTIFTFPPLVALTFWRQNCSASYADVGKFYLCTGQTGGWGVTRMRPSRVGPHNKLLTCCVPTETQPPSISETRNEKAYCRWLGRWYVCMLHYESSVYEWLRNTASAY